MIDGGSTATSSVPTILLKAFAFAAISFFSEPDADCIWLTNCCFCPSGMLGNFEISVEFRAPPKMLQPDRATEASSREAVAARARRDTREDMFFSYFQTGQSYATKGPLCQ